MGYSVFHYAASFGYIQLLQILLAKYPKRIFELEDPLHPIHLAIAGGQRDCVLLILEHENNYSMESSPRMKDNCTDTITGWSSACDSLAFTQRLDELAVKDLSSRKPWHLATRLPFPVDLERATPLHIAARCNHIEIASLLIERGVSANILDGHSRTPLHFAASEGRLAMLDLLLDSGANIHAVDRSLQTACMIAASRSQVETVRILIAKGADLLARDKYGQTALDIAADLWSFSTLISSSDEHDIGRDTTLDHSTFSRILETGTSILVLLIVHYAPKPSAYEPHNSNVLTAVVQNHEISIQLFKIFIRRIPRPLIPILLSHRARLGGTPLYAACTTAAPNLQAGIIDTLLRIGAQLDFEGGEHGTPLMGACATGRLKVVKLLVSRGASIYYKNDSCVVSAVQAARRYPEITRWLLVGRFVEGPRLVTDCDQVKH